MKNKTLLVTGGSGFIGSHTVLELVRNKITVVVIDNLSNSSKKNIDRIKSKYKNKVLFHKVDLLKKYQIQKVFKKYKSISSVIHFAALKSVPESIKLPTQYYQNNVVGTLNLLDVMKKNKCKNLIFSSSACVYSEKVSPPYKEIDNLGYKNPYAHSKLIIEDILSNISKADKNWNICILRYFNPAGSDSLGLIGEENLNQTNLFPQIAQVILGNKKYIKIFGSNYKTKDGTAVRDYIHVSDIALGHISAINYLSKNCFSVFNLGSGSGFTVMEVIKEFEKILKIKIPIKFTKRRIGDAGISYSNIASAKKILKWKPKKNLSTLCKDTYEWSRNNY